MGIRSLVISMLIGSPAPAPDVAAIDAAFEPGTVTVTVDGVDRSFPYRILRPDAASAESPLPLLVFLHGAGERGDDNTAQLRHFPERWIREPHLGRRHPAIVVAVQCPKGATWSPVEPDDDGFWRARGDGVEPAMRGVESLIATLAADPAVDRSRIYLTGLSMGGFGSWDLVGRHGDWFAAVVPICGGGDPADAQAIVESGVPIWNLHGDADRVVPVELSRTMVGAIRAAGGRIGNTELPGVGHNSWSWAYGPNGIVDWMFAQRRPRPAAVGVDPPAHP